MLTSTFRRLVMMSSYKLRMIFKFARTRLKKPGVHEDKDQNQFEVTGYQIEFLLDKSITQNFDGGIWEMLTDDGHNLPHS